MAAVMFINPGKKLAKIQENLTRIFKFTINITRLGKFEEYTLFTA